MFTHLFFFCLYVIVGASFGRKFTRTDRALPTRRESDNGLDADSKIGAYLPSLFDLKGKVAIVTGSTGGLGSLMAEALYCSGANVVIHGRSKLKCINCADSLYGKYSRSTGLLQVAADISSRVDIHALINATIAEFGKIDILINNAGINLPEHSFENSTKEEWEYISGINLLGSMELTRLALPWLRKSPAGRVINIGSICGHIAIPNNTLYSVTKAGMLQFTRSLAAELTDTNITVNSISPGVFDTPMNAKYQTQQYGYGVTHTSERKNKIISRIPLQRMGQPIELVGMVVYLASHAASYTTGTDIIVDGGYTGE